MVETRHILPPEHGPASDPLLYGVAEALARLFPVDERHLSRGPRERLDERSPDADAAVPPAERGAVPAE